MKHRRYTCLNSNMSGHRKFTITHDGEGAICHQSKLCGVMYPWENQKDTKGKLVSGKRPKPLKLVIHGSCRAICLIS